MSISSDFHDERRTLSLEGPFTIYEAGASKARLLAALSEASGLDIDLSGVVEFDTAGIQILLLLKREAARQEKPLVFLGHSRSVLAVLDLYNMGGVFGDPVVLSGEGRS
ncbi:STAS domain-containing protein [Chitinimonas sp. BJB300]|uniref:STAS domain-containing protein n=1 Tax=Chitinimonas sp. BJB300 TaxID=1559339 RepID=UPI000C0FD7F3|nr:STAS domain-containing protein [Chitinimonas sp. BJB300]PHV13050.1 anti-sigma B factor antagonist [Chitinimonas sp. BJB300]TSJ87740.1 STAS domain-containing protein [Chitinimonas sp. BJB300]